MNARFTPLTMMALLALALGAALMHRAPIPPSLNGAIPALSLRPLADAPGKTTWQPTPGRVTLVNFFASWCLPCLAEHPQITQLAGEDIDLVGIAWNDTPQATENWLEQHGNPYKTVWLDDGEAAIAMGIRGVPESFLIGPDGTIREHWRGAIPPAALTAVRARIQQAKANHAPAGR